jgi:hypothetical protein
MCSGAEECLDAAYDGWARALLGSPPWRCASVAAGELGWRLSGFARAVLDVACRRARLWTLPDDDIYRIVFVRAGDMAGPSWAKQSRDLLATWGVPDWPLWAGPQSTVCEYVALARDTLETACLARWRGRVASHKTPVAYNTLQANPSTALHASMLPPVPWKVFVGQRSWCRLRSGLVDLGHRGGRRTAARWQQCIGCGKVHRSVWIHVFAECPQWHVERTAMQAGEDSEPDGSRLAFAMRVLQSRPGQQGYPEAVALAAAIERTARTFWAAAADANGSE